MTTVLLPDEPVPVRLMNTIWADRSGVHDSLTTASDLRSWLATIYPDSNHKGAELDRFRALRDALRRLAALVVDDDRPEAASAMTDARQAVAEVNRAAARAPTWPRLAIRGGELWQAVDGLGNPGDRLLAEIARQAIQLFSGDDRPEPTGARQALAPKLRACHAPGCVLYFVRDHPRREWCSTACGNRARVARHYDRHHRQGT